MSVLTLHGCRSLHRDPPPHTPSGCWLRLATNSALELSCELRRALCAAPEGDKAILLGCLLLSDREGVEVV